MKGSPGTEGLPGSPGDDGAAGPPGMDGPQGPPVSIAARESSKLICSHTRGKKKGHNMPERVIPL